jgi:hypothetical protein
MPEPEILIRRPRHIVQDDGQVAVWVTSLDADQSWHFPATLVDVSRNGCRLFAADSLMPGDKIRLVMDLPVAERRTDALAEIRWQKEATSGEREYGLEFLPALEWEFLGELFLSGTLESR